VTRIAFVPPTLASSEVVEIGSCSGPLSPAVDIPNYGPRIGLIVALST